MARPSTADAVLSNGFASTFGDALNRFLTERGIGQSDVARDLGLGKAGRARIHRYCSTTTKRPKPDAEILYLLCTKLGFRFEYNGFVISAGTLNGNRLPIRTHLAEQLKLRFDGQFKLTDQETLTKIRVKRPPGRIELSISLKTSV